MKKWIVDLRDAVCYTIEADTEEEAIELAYEYWDMREPDVFCEEVEEEENLDVVFHNAPSSPEGEFRFNQKEE